MNPDQFQQLLAEHGVTLNEHQLAQFDTTINC